MGKYGSGVSMREVIELELNEISEALDRGKMTFDDAEVVKDAYLEACFRWCNTNAVFCAFEEFVHEKHPDVWEELLHGFLHDATYQRTYQKKMQATWPY